MPVRKLIRYAGYDPSDHTFLRKVPAERASELRDNGMTWKDVADQLTIETSRPVAFTGDSVHAAVMWWRNSQ